MEITVLVEPLPSNGFRAISGEPLHLQTAAPTREEAIRKLRELIEERTSAGAELVALQLEQPAHPLAPYAGILKNDSLLEPWKDAMRAYREQKDSDTKTQ